MLLAFHCPAVVRAKRMVKIRKAIKAPSVPTAAQSMAEASRLQNEYQQGSDFVVDRLTKVASPLRSPDDSAYLV
jgi:hypothetical protein